MIVLFLRIYGKQYLCVVALLGFPFQNYVPIHYLDIDIWKVICFRFSLQPVNLKQ